MAAVARHDLSFMTEFPDPEVRSRVVRGDDPTGQGRKRGSQPLWSPVTGESQRL